MKPNYQIYCCINRPKYVISDSDYILKVVSSHTSVPIHQMQKNGGIGPIPEAKHIARYFIYNYTKLSLYAVGLKTGSINHTTTLKSLRVLQGWIETDKTIREKVEKIEQVISFNLRKQNKVTRGFYE